jgi:U3 small nucleolar ribonucleoprotein protein IMP4
MLRKNIRLRKEYLYSKSQEQSERNKQDKRLAVQKAEDNDRKAPNELRKELPEIKKDLALADDKTILARSHVDDEYEDAKYRDPKLLLTTCRNPS